ncbi:contactin-3-like [Haliotis cracherodii]|uniref:contactin-3-like n=1 Tax=Haliotis cracherodii TaxID=6455 RepID=UPI0039EB395B
MSRSMIITFYTQLVLTQILIKESVQQVHVFDCPSDWVSSWSQCYKFVSFPEEAHENARAACAYHGAALLSVDSGQEHNFISSTIQRMDPYQRSWYTSGVQKSQATGTTTVSSQGSFVSAQGSIQSPSGSQSEGDDLSSGSNSQSESESMIGAYKWLGDGTVVGYDKQFWLPGIDFKQGEVIVYKYGVIGYGWSLVHPGDKLPYICEISMAESYRIVHVDRDYDYGLVSYDPNELLRGPAFVTQPESLVVVGKTIAATIECTATGNPRPKYKWFTGQNFETEVTPELSSRYTLTNGKLVLEKPAENEDADQYRCSVENEFGKILGNPIQISFGSLGEFSNVPDAAVRAKAYDGVAIQCSRIPYRPAVKYQWLKGDTRSFVRPQMQPYIFISANGKLYFSEVTRIDEGEYRCIAILTGRNRHTIGTSQPPTRTSLPIPLLVHDQAAKADWGPEIQNDFIAVFPQPPLKGQEVRLECFAYGSSTTQFLYQWDRSDRPIPRSARVLDHSRVLVIEDAKLEDSGNYTCTVSRGTSARDSKSYYLDIAAKPYFIVPLQNQHVDINSQLTWRCVARASPNPTYMWYKNGEVLQQVPGDTLITGSTLTILKLDPEKHNGMYQCSAKNTHGETMSAAQLRVLSIAPTFHKHPLPRYTKGAVRGNVTIMCEPEGAPQPKITWFKNGVELPENSGHYRLLRNGNIVVTDLQASDVGTYRCTATNEIGEASSATKLTVSRETRISTAPTNTKVLVNTTAFFYCQASFDPHLDMVYVWTFNGRMIDFHDQTHFIQDTNPLKTGIYILNVGFKNAGEYRCTAETTLEEDSRMAVLTVMGPPGEPAGVFVEAGSVTSHGAQVRWSPGAARGRPILYYVIETATNFDPKWREIVRNLPDIMTLNDQESLQHIRQADVVGLKPGTGYIFRIRAINQYGIGDPSLPSPFIQTPSAPPIKAPDNVRGGGGSVGDLTIAWDPMPPDDHGGPGIGYNIYYRLKDGKDGLWQYGKVVGNQEKYVALVGNDYYFLEYEVKVQAFNVKGLGPNSTIEIVYSAEALPVGVPSNIGADGYNGTCLEVWWDPVPDTREYMKGRVKGYQINYWPNDESDPTDWMQFIRFPGQVSEGMVIGLEQNGWTWMDVQVYNSAGLGPRMEAYTQETLHHAPLLYPEEVRIYSHGSNSVRVWWRGISTTIAEDSVTGFKLYYWPASEDYRSADIYETDEVVDTCILEGLDKGVLYALRIAGVSPGGDGKKTPTKYFTLGGSVRIDSTMASSMTIRAGAEKFRASVIGLLLPLLLALHIL